MFERIVNIAKKHPSIIKLGVFGSFARREQTFDSDLDLLIDYDDKQINDYITALCEMKERCAREIDELPYYVLFDNKNTQLFQNIMNDLKWIYRRD